MDNTQGQFPNSGSSPSESYQTNSSLQQGQGSYYTDSTRNTSRIGVSTTSQELIEAPVDVEFHHEDPREFQQPQVSYYSHQQTQPAYEQSSYEQSSYEQSAYGQPAYGQPEYGRPQYGRPAYDQLQYQPQGPLYQLQFANNQYPPATRSAETPSIPAPVGIMISPQMPASALTGGNLYGTGQVNRNGQHDAASGMPSLTTGGNLYDTGPVNPNGNHDAASCMPNLTAEATPPVAGASEAIHQRAARLVKQEDDWQNFYHEVVNYDGAEVEQSGENMPRPK